MSRMTPEEVRTWTRVTRAEPCGICEKPDWCTRGGKGWCCMRVESPKMLRNGGWYHPFDATATAHPLPPPPRRLKVSPPAPAPDFGAIMEGYWAANREPGEAADQLREEAERLGVSVRALQWLGAAWAPDRRALAIPMYDATDYNGHRPVGVRFRTPAGKKFAIPGSTSGIFYPYGAMHTLSPFARLYFCEGPTDTAAALDMGCFAVGRPACRGAETFIASVLEQLAPDEVVIITDNDSAGLQGTRDLLRHIRTRKKILVPPGKDLRRFRQDGGTRELLEVLLGEVLWS
jgi:hypothetical protein